MVQVRPVMDCWDRQVDMMSCVLAQHGGASVGACAKVVLPEQFEYVCVTV